MGGPKLVLPFFLPNSRYLPGTAFCVSGRHLSNHFRSLSPAHPFPLARECLEATPSPASGADSNNGHGQIAGGTLDGDLFIHLPSEQRLADR
jgi:hypothetical protein